MWYYHFYGDIITLNKTSSPTVKFKEKMRFSCYFVYLLLLTGQSCLTLLLTSRCSLKQPLQLPPSSGSTTPLTRRSSRATWSSPWPLWSSSAWRKVPAVNSPLEWLPWTMPARMQVQLQLCLLIIYIFSEKICENNSLYLHNLPSCCLVMNNIDSFRTFFAKVQ